MCNFKIEQGFYSDFCHNCYGNKNVKRVFTKEDHNQVVNPLCEDCRKELAIELMKDIVDDMPIE